MWQRLRSPLLFLSLGMNVAFLVVLGFLYFTGFPGGKKGLYHDRHPGHRTHEKHREKRPKDPGWRFYRHKVGVSETQWRNLRPDMEAFHRKAYRICRRIRKLRNEVLRALESADPDTAVIEQKEEKILQLKRRKQRLFIEYMRGKKQSLTPGQQERFFGMLRKGRNCDRHARFLEDIPGRKGGQHHRGG